MSLGGRDRHILISPNFHGGTCCEKTALRPFLSDYYGRQWMGGKRTTPD